MVPLVSNLACANEVTTHIILTSILLRLPIMDMFIGKILRTSIAYQMDRVSLFVAL